MTDVEIAKTLRDIESIISTEGLNNPGNSEDRVNFGWKVANAENLGSVYYKKINALQDAVKIIAKFSDGDPDYILESLEKDGDFNDAEPLFLHFYITSKE